MVVLYCGHIVQIGNHTELMAREGFYYRLYQAQARNIDTEDSTTIISSAEHSASGEYR